MSAPEAPRANRNGDRCPEWCTADHDELLIPGKPVFGYMNGHASDPMTAELLPTAVRVRRSGLAGEAATVDIDRVVTLISLTPDRAKALASLLACCRSWEDIGQLVDELRIAATIAGESDGAR